MAPPLLLLDEVSLTFGGDPLLNGASLSVEREERVALVGRNGSGKSTLLKIAAGMLEADKGTRFLQPGSTLRYLPQEPQFGTHETVLSYVEEGLGPADDIYQARYFLEQLGLRGDENPAQLSGGEARRAALARALAPNPDILLLDEPTNHLDLPTIEWLESELSASKSALVLISHDRRFLQKLTRSTVWIDRGVTQQLKMGFEAFEPWRDAQFELEEQQRHKLDRKIAREEDWMRYGVTARRKRNVRRLADFHALKEQRRTARRAPGQVSVSAAEADSSGKLIIDAQNLSLSYEQRPIVKNFSTRIHRGDRIGIVGPNGAGKTTLLNILVGRLSPDAGTLQLGANIEMALLEQLRTQLNPAWTVAEALTGGQGDSVMVGGEQRHVMAYMQDFLFSPAQARTPLSVLSGGERARLMLARAFAKPSNFLVLDEPTNDLDIETLDVLEEMIGNYKGTVILISHDRDFIDRTVNAVIVAEGDGTWIEYAGGYSDMIAQRGEQRKTQAAVQKSAPKPQVPAPEKAPSRKLSFKDKHALETLPAAMAELEKKIAQLQARLDDPSLYQRDRAAFDATSQELATAQSKLSEAEEKWLELECLREALEG